MHENSIGSMSNSRRKVLLPNDSTYYIKAGLRDNSLQARGGKENSNLKKARYFSAFIDIYFVGGGNLGQPGHGHDIAGERHQKARACRYL